MSNHRVLVVADDPQLLREFRELTGDGTSRTWIVRDSDGVRDRIELPSFEVIVATQGQSALTVASRALAAGKPLALAVVAERLQVGWDGVQTVRRLWEIQPELQVALLADPAGQSWAELAAQLDQAEQLLVWQQPLSSAEVRQLTLALTARWNQTQWQHRHVDYLESSLRQRTAELLAEKEAAETTGRAASDHLHEVFKSLRPALAAIAGLAAGIRPGVPLAPHAWQSTVTIRNQAEQLLSLVDGVLES